MIVCVISFTQTHLPQFKHEMDKAALWCTTRTHRMAVGRGRGGSSGSISAAAYLVLLGDVLLVILLHLPELGLQPTQLDLHLLHILQVPLGPLVQHLNGLGHVLDLRRWTEASDGVMKGVSDIQSRGFKEHPAAARCVAHNAPRRPVGGLDTWRKHGTQTVKTFVFPPGPTIHKRHKVGTTSIYVFIRWRWI